MSTWGYTRLSNTAAWPQTAADSIAISDHDPVCGNNQAQQLARKRLRWDFVGASYGGKEAALCSTTEQEYSWLHPEFEGIGSPEIIPTTFPDEARNSREVDMNNQLYMPYETTSFLDDDADASVVTSSCHFSLSDVGAGIEFFDQAPPEHKEMDMEMEMEESWDAINNLGDMDDIFGHKSLQPSSLDVQRSTSPQKSSPGCTETNIKTVCPGSQKNAPDDATSVASAAPSKPVHWLPEQLDGQSKGPENCESWYPPPTLGQETCLQQQQQKTEPRPTGLIIEQQQFQVPGSRAELPSATNDLAFNSFTTTENSLEAAVLFQLGCTMSKLDVETRLCISNALYRLARSASCRSGDENPSRKQSFANSSRSGDVACLETCTNPIDRTVASLLFYKQTSEECKTPGSLSPQSIVVSSSSSSWSAPESAGAAASGRYLDYSSSSSHRSK